MSPSSKNSRRSARGQNSDKTAKCPKQASSPNSQACLHRCKGGTGYAFMCRKALGQADIFGCVKSLGILWHYTHMHAFFCRCVYTHMKLKNAPSQICMCAHAMLAFVRKAFRTPKKHCSTTHPGALLKQEDKEEVCAVPNVYCGPRQKRLRLFLIDPGPAEKVGGPGVGDLRSMVFLGCKGFSSSFGQKVNR